MYKDNDVLILPYKQVTQCGPLLIGFAYNVPVICNDLSGFREYVDEGKSGLFFKSTPEDLANKMEHIINDKAMIKSMNEYIKTKTFEKFSMKTLTNEYLSNF